MKVYPMLQARRAISAQSMTNLVQACHEFDNCEELDMLKMGGSIDATDWIPTGSTTTIGDFYHIIAATMPRE